MERIKVTVTKDWAGAKSGETPVLVFEIPFPDFGEKKDPLAPKRQFIKIVKRSKLGSVGALARTLSFLPASMHVPGFTMEACMADVYSWHEAVNAIHEALRLMDSIDYAFPPDGVVEVDDLCDEAVALALGTNEFDLTVADGCEYFWERADTVSICGRCLSPELCTKCSGEDHE